MSTSYIVNRTKGRWTVTRQTDFGPYRSREEAVRDALDVAQYSKERGLDVAVYIHERSKGQARQHIARRARWMQRLKELAKIGAT